MVKVSVASVTDFDSLGQRWRDLEQRSDASFFQSWTWVGTLASERFPDPVLVEATEAGRTVALGLFNRVRRRFGPCVLYLAETGSAELDCPYIEQNGILTEAGHEVELTALCLRPLTAAYEVVLSGVGTAALTAAHRAAGLVLTQHSAAAPFADLAAIRRSGGDYLAARSANTRQQLRRSDRFYQRAGPITLQRADSPESAHTMLQSLADLHQASWGSRGAPGSFARPFFPRFHHALIDTGFPRGEIVLLRVSCHETTIGYLYNFAWRNRMIAYQSGFVYRDQDNQAKPGLTSHHAAIRAALHEEIDIYDFLAGEDRYKRSLADRANPQFWLCAGPCWSPRLLLRLALRRLRSTAASPENITGSPASAKPATATDR